MRNSKDRTFSDKIKVRVRLLWVVLILMLVYMVVIAEMGFGDSRIMTDLADGVSTIIFFGGLIYVIVLIIRNKRLLYNRNLLISHIYPLHILPYKSHLGNIRSHLNWIIIWFMLK